MIASSVTGMVLSAMPIGDYDKRLVLLTRERGKITAFAKGARRQNSAFLACSQPFSFGEFMVYEGKTSFSIVSANITNYFEDIRKDLEGVYYGLYFCELADYFGRENEDGTQMLKLLYQSLRALNLDSISNSLIRHIYELKLLALNGLTPQVFQCVKCKKEDSNFYFHSESGGLVCPDCRKKILTSVKYISISSSTIYTMQYIITSSIEKLFTFTVSDQVRRELEQCMGSYCKVYIDRKMKSLEFLENLL